MSFWFYGYFQINYLLIMVLSIAGNYLFHILLSRAGSRARAKSLLVLAVTANLGVLFYFKYYDFFVDNVNALFGTSFMLKHVLLPLGISFFTFQQIGFIVDTYRGEGMRSVLLCFVRLLFPSADCRTDRQTVRNAAAVCSHNGEKSRLGEDL